MHCFVLAMYHSQTCKSGVPLRFISHIDSTVGLDQMLIQLKEVEPHWKKLAEAVGLDGLDQIAEYVREDL